MGAVIHGCGLLSALFCACLLLRRRRVQSLLRSRLRQWLDENVRITYSPPSEANRSQVEALFAMLYELLVARSQRRPREGDKISKRLRAWHRLRRLLCGPLSDQFMWHYCPYGCHDSREQVVEDILKCYTVLFLDHPEKEPAVNKWSRLLPPILWFGVFLASGKALQGCIDALSAVHDNETNLSFDEDDVVGLDDSRAYMLQDLVRLRKTPRFIAAPVVPLKLVVCALALLPVQQVMNTCFQVY